VFDIGAMVIFGVFGYLLRKGGFPAVPLILAMLLGRILERSVQQSLIMSGGEVLVFIQRPISLVLLLVAAFLLFTPAVRWLWRQRRVFKS
jgi:putative tricarboxylic transport membrane protein